MNKFQVCILTFWAALNSQCVISMTPKERIEGNCPRFIAAKNRLQKYLDIPIPEDINNIINPVCDKDLEERDKLIESIKEREMDEGWTRYKLSLFALKNSGENLKRLLMHRPEAETLLPQGCSKDDINKFPKMVTDFEKKIKQLDKAKLLLDQHFEQTFDYAPKKELPIGLRKIKPGKEIVD